MIGIDIISIHRIQNNLTKYGEDFLKKFLLPSEIELVKTPYKASSIAGFWAAKEACSKALGVGISDELRFFDMKISKTSKNAPIIELSEEKMDYFKLKSLSLSISHDGGFAIAVVAITKQD